MPERSIEINDIGKEVVLDFTDFIKWYDFDPAQRTVAWERMHALKIALEKSDEKIKDPIEFLYRLYFHKKMALLPILQHPIIIEAEKMTTLYKDSGKETTILEEGGINSKKITQGDNEMTKTPVGDERQKSLYSGKGLRDLFVNSFGWQLRKKTDRTPEHIKTNQERIARILGAVSDREPVTLNSQKHYAGFSIRRFNTVKHRIDKVLYVLKYLGDVDSNRLMQTFHDLEYGERSMLTYLNGVTEKVLNNYPGIGVSKEDLELTRESVIRWTRNWNGNIFDDDNSVA